ncbi:MAG: peptide ABC transporter substrate-binding protein [Candidatus Sumerlaeia bacterium]|nr:peptide ABC transporter substrate-binding protein [Candidatus Sumerlaeia bacterium]
MNIRLALTGAALSILLVACGGGEERDDSERPSRSQARIPEKTLRINISIEPETLDPSLINGINEGWVMSGLMEGLIRLDENTQPQPAAAERWEHNEDYSVWTFHIREDAVWHNGDPLTAHDYIYSIERTSSPDTASTYAQNVYSFIKGGAEFFDNGGLRSGESMEGLRAIDDKTIEFTLSGPMPYFITVLQFTAWLPIHRDTVETHGDGWYLSPRTFNGNGPFRMTEYRSQSHIGAERFEDYWNKDAIFWENVRFYMITSESTQDAAFRTGDIDVTAGVPVAEVDHWKDQPEYRNQQTFGTYYVSFNTTAAPFDNVDVRRAFSKTINRAMMTQQVTRRGEIIPRGIVPASLASVVEGKTYRERAGDFVGRTNVEEARQLLVRAGYNDNNPFPSVEYMYNTAESHRIISEQLQSMWSRGLGVDVRIQNKEWGVYLQDIAAGNFQFARSAWFGDYVDAIAFLEIFETGNAKNAPKFSNARFDALLAQARQEADLVAREDLLIEAEKILLEEECAVAPIYHYTSPILVRTDIEGLTLNSIANMVWIHSRRTSGGS